MTTDTSQQKYKHPPLNRSVKGRKPLARIFNRIWGVLVRFFYRPRFYGVENIPADGPVILTGNHTSLMDVTLIHPVVPRWVYWVAKDELRTKPFVGKIFTSFEVIYLERDKLDVTAVKQIMGKLRGNEVLGIFPQGTRVAADKIQESGASTGLVSIMQKTGAAIVPFYIDAPYRLFKPMDVIFGEAYVLPKGKRKASEEVMEALQNTVMRKIFDLGDIAYRPEREERDAAILRDHSEEFTG